MLYAILINDEIEFREENINNGQLATYNDLLNYCCLYGTAPENVDIKIKEGLVRIEDGEIIELFDEEKASSKGNK